MHFSDYLIFMYFAAQKVLYYSTKSVQFRDYSTKKKNLSFRFAKMVKRQYLKKYFIFQLANCTGLKT